MSIIRLQKHTDKYVILDKTFLEDMNISLRLKGFLAFCLSKPDHWQFHVRQLSDVLKEGKDALYSIIDEGIEHGYITRQQNITHDGKFSSNDYIIREVPIKKEKPQPAFPDTVTTQTDSPTLVSNDNSKEIQERLNVVNDPAKQGKKYKRPDRTIPHCLKFSPKALPPEEQQKLANQFSEAVLVEAIQDAITFNKDVAKIDKLPAWLTDRCKKIARKNVT